MSYLNDRVYDSGLAVLTAEANRLEILSAEPQTYAEAGALSLGSRLAPQVSTPAPRGGGGRQVTVSAVDDGAVTASGQASHWALLDTAAGRLLAAAPLAAAQAVTAGSAFTLTAFTVGIPAPAA